MAIKLHPPELVASDCGNALAALVNWAVKRDEELKLKNRTEENQEN